MGYGLKEYRERQAAEEARRAAAGAGSFNRFALEKDGDSAILRFAQEIDYDAKNYDKERGIGFVNIEHNHPDPKVGWKNRANCSLESQGDCLPCSKVQDRSVEWDQRKGWKQKEKFYVNVVAGSKEVSKTVNGKERTYTAPADIDRKTGDGTVFLLEQGTFNGIYDQLAEIALENETITDIFFKITRKGSGFNDTSYILTPLKEIPADAKALSEFELVDIKDKALSEVPFAQQEAFYFKGVAGSGNVAPATEAAPAAPADEAW